ncbi:SDR family oxidoreductase [Kribbella sp. CA-253562]|uniref:SDR family oxidoreductase n=1 Tax=Kribbella sp. CA-253562 TaxID=3239942 RepID=UPI003D904BA9
MIVVTGATGNIGRTLVRALVDAGEEVAAVSRKAAELPPGVRHQAADLTSDKLELSGARALFVLPPGGWYDADALLENARTAGVRRVVLLSSQGVGTNRHPAVLEDAVKQSGLEWSVLRPSGFQSNTLGWSQSVRERRTVEAPYGEIALPQIHPADIAEVAAVALRDPASAGTTWELTGPIGVSPREQTAAIAEALGEPVRFVELTREQARERFLRFMPEQVTDSTLAILGHPNDAERRVSPDVERVLGRPARGYADWLADHLAAFR